MDMMFAVPYDNQVEMPSDVVGYSGLEFGGEVLPGDINL